jgi:hypothetical protein
MVLDLRFWLRFFEPPVVKLSTLPTVERFALGGLLFPLFPLFSLLLLLGLGLRLLSCFGLSDK